jgi:hypothetical protein
VRVVVPSWATDGSYKSDVVVTGVGPHGSGQAAAGAAAATIISSTVRGGSPNSFPWLVSVIIVALFLLILLVSQVRRSGLRLKVERPSHATPARFPNT